MKTSTRYQLVRDGELYNTVYDHRYEAIETGNILVDCEWIKSFEVIPIKAVWLRNIK